MFFSKIKSKLVVLFISLAIISGGNTYASVENMAYGINIKSAAVFSTSLGAFFEYKFNEYLGIETGVEYTFRDFCVVYPGTFFGFQKIKKLNYTNDGQPGGNKYDYSTMTENEAELELNKHIKNAESQNAKDFGLHHYNYISLPLIVNTYPGGGNFVIYFGASFDILTSVNGFTKYADIKNKKDMLHAFDKLEALGDADNKNNWVTEGYNIKNLKGLDQNAKKPDNEGKPGVNIYNKIAIKAIIGMKYIFPLGIILGVEGKHTLRSFINKENNHTSYEGNLRLVLGLDIAKLIKFIN